MSTILRPTLETLLLKPFASSLTEHYLSTVRHSLMVLSRIHSASIDRLLHEITTTNKLDQRQVRDTLNALMNPTSDMTFRYLSLLRQNVKLAL